MAVIDVLSLPKRNLKVEYLIKIASKRALIVFLLVALLLPQFYFPQTTAVAQGLVTIPMVSAGYHHSLALKDDGTVWAWGLNNEGQLGDGTKTQRYTPIQVNDLTDVVGVDAGYQHSLALKKDGTVWAWGWNGAGVMGDGSSVWRRENPVQVLELTNVIAISAGDFYSLALKEDGTVWAWGENAFGKLGDGTERSKYIPVQVLGLNNVVAVSAGGNSSLALKEDGTVWAWGCNSYGQVGDGTTRDRYLPVQVSDLTNIVMINAGQMHSLAIKEDGTVWAWGYNYHGQLGDGSILGVRHWSTTPVKVKDLTDAVMVSAQWYGSLALNIDGTVWAWGSGKRVPEKVSELTDMIEVSAGQLHYLALKEDGTVWAWGRNKSGELGDGTEIGSSTPVQSLINLGETDPPLQDRLPRTVDIAPVVDFWKLFAEEYHLVISNLETSIFVSTDLDLYMYFSFLVSKGLVSPITAALVTGGISGLMIAKIVDVILDVVYDPPDNNFYRVVELETVETIIPSDNSQLAGTMAQCANDLVEKRAIWDAILVTLERLQGAEIANEPNYVVLQARQLRYYSGLLLQNQQHLKESLSSLKEEIVVGFELNYDEVMDELNRLSTYGLSPEERELLIESGITPTEIQMFDDLLRTLAINEEQPYSIQEALDLWVLRINETVLPNLEKGIQDIDKLLELLIKLGDLTGSGNVDIQDVTLAMQYVLGLKVLTSEQKIAADVNGDGKVDIRDVVHIMQRVLLLIDRFPVEQ